MNIIRIKLASFDKLSNAIVPTPVHELPVLSEIAGCRIFCKRDDLTGFGFGGNKARKLDYLVADALQQGCDTLLAVGAAQSNFCRMAASYAAVHGMKAHLVLGGDKPERPTGNLLLDHLLGAVCHHIGSEDWEDYESHSSELERNLTELGRKVYRLPMGGSTPIGSLGYTEAMAEIIDDQKRLGVTFDTIVFASSSAGTQAGLVVGKMIAEWPGTVLGISVARKTAIHTDNVFKLACETGRLLNVSIDRTAVCVDDNFIGDGYAARTDSCDEAVEFFARRCGIFLDYVYSGKAAAGLLEYCRSGKFRNAGAVLFIHTGGNIELFA